MTTPRDTDQLSSHVPFQIAMNSIVADLKARSRSSLATLVRSVRQVKKSGVHWRTAAIRAMNLLRCPTVDMVNALSAKRISIRRN